MNKTIIASLVLALSISSVNAGWHETFDTPATPSAALTFTSDMTWAWWGWGTAEVDSGYLTLVGALDPFENNTSWIQIAQNIDANAVITPDSVTMYLKVKFTTTGTPTNGDQLHVTVATDPEFLSNLNVYTVVSSPVGLIGDFYFQTNESAGSLHPAIVYDSWFWEKIVVSGDTVSVWAFADGEAPTDTANYTFTPDGVALGTAAPTFFIIGLTDDDSSAVLINEVWYNETPTGMGISDDAPIASSYELSQNYPNPFNPTTHIRFNIPETGLVNITIYDMLGRQIKSLINQTLDAGYISIIWDATNDYGKPVSAGIYLYQIQAGEYISTKKMVLLK